MSFVYSYRPEMGIRDSKPMRHYDHLYQRTECGTMIPWQMGMWFPVIVREEGLPLYKAQATADTIDQWMANFMMANQGMHEARGRTIANLPRDLAMLAIWHEVRVRGQRDAG